jgi:hypothetical protein
MPTHLMSQAGFEVDPIELVAKRVEWAEDMEWVVWARLECLGWLDGRWLVYR